MAENRLGRYNDNKILGTMLLILIIAHLLSNYLVLSLNAVLFTVASVKDALHIDEWIDYHRVLGYQHIYILDTDNSFSELKTIHDGIVTLLGKSAGMTGMGLKDLYAAFPRLFSDELAWCTFLSVNDFVVLRNHSTIHEAYLSMGDSALSVMPVYDAVSTEVNFYPQAILKRATLRSLTTTSTRFSAVLSNIAGFYDNLEPVLKNGQTLPGLHNKSTSPAVMVFSVSLLTRTEHRWYVEWLCGEYPQSVSGVVGDHDRRDYSAVCSVYHDSSASTTDSVAGSSGSAVGIVGQTHFRDRYSSDSEWMRWFDAYYDALRSEYESAQLVEDTAAWEAYKAVFTWREVSNATKSLYNENDLLYRHLILGDIPDPPSEGVLLTFSQGLAIAQTFERRTLTLHRGRDLAMQMVQFCVDYVLHPRDCPAVAQRAINMIRDMDQQQQTLVMSGSGGIDSSSGTSLLSLVDEDWLGKIIAYYQSLFHMFEPTAYEQLRRSMNDLTKIHHREECYRGWRSGETMLLSSQNKSFLMYVINHDDASEALIYDTLFHISSSRRSGGNGVLVPVRVRSSVFFEYIAYREVLPGRYVSEWSQLQYVGITTYKTVVQYASLCTYELERLLAVGAAKDYDVIPFVRSNHDVMVRSVLNHGRTYRYAWDAVLTALGYNQSTIRRYDRMKPFYRSSMLIKPSWLVRLSQFMSRAMEVVQFNATLYEMCSVDARYEGNNEVSLKIFGTASYQLFPFIFERLAVFYLISEGASVCQGNEDCPYNAFWC